MSYDLYLEDFKPGDRFETGGVTVTESKIIDYALEWDPQPFHIDAEVGRAHPFGTVFASGLHTLSLLFRLFAQSGVIGKCSYAGAEMSLKWVKPVMPGDTIRAVFEVIETREFKSRPGLGSLTMTHLAINQRDETVIDCTCTHIIRKRPADPDKPGKLG
jgi:acyl dehydratase